MSEVKSRRGWKSIHWLGVAYVVLGASALDGFGPHSLLTMLLVPAQLLLLTAVVRALPEFWEARGPIHPAWTVALAILPYLVFAIASFLIER